MIIISLIDSFNYCNIGGAGRVFYETNEILASLGHHVFAIHKENIPSSKTYSSKVNVNSYCDISANSFSKILYYQKTIKRIFLETIKENKPDIIILHSSTSAFGLKNILKTLKIPIIYVFHSPWSMEYDILTNRNKLSFFNIKYYLYSILSKIRKYHEYSYLSMASGIVTLSKYMQETMLQEHKSLKKIPMKVIYGGADTKRFFPTINKQEKIDIRKRLKLAENGIFIISTRRLVPRTGVDILITAFAKAKKHFKGSIKLIITGRGSEEANLKQLALEKDLNDDIIFVGYISEKDFPDYYRASDFSIMPTKELEGFGLSTVEALASGILVIGTNLGGTPEILKTISDKLLIPECTEDAISKKLIEFTDLELIDSFKSTSLEVIEKYFNWESHTKRLIHFIKNFL